MLVYNSPYNEIRSVLNIDDKCFFVDQDLDLDGNVDFGYFQINLNLFTESQSFHTFFNRKMYITSDLQVKNFPSQIDSFGNLYESNSLAIIESNNFQKYWTVHKNKVDVCKDCELRHMCIDPRIPFNRPDGSWYHKKECNYNPYIAKWEGEDGYEVLSKVGIESNENKFTIDHKKLKKVLSNIYSS